MDESGKSLSFVSILFTVSLALIALSAQELEDKPTLALPLLLSFVGCFYASIAYATLSGDSSRGLVMQTWLLGNILSEWFGIYQLIAVFAPLVVVLVGPVVGTVTLGVNLVGYLIYWLSGVSLLDRCGGHTPIILHLSYVVSTAIFGVGFVVDSAKWSNVGVGLVVASTVGMALVHYQAGRGTVRGPDPLGLDITFGNPEAK